MNNEQKAQVREALVRYANNFPTQSMAADSLHGISASTISQVKNHNWELLSDRLWDHIARQVGFYRGDWRPADTSAYLLLRILFSDAQHYAMSYGIAMSAGLGKTFTAGRYMRENESVYYISCNEEYNRKSFMTTLMHNAGIAAAGTVPKMMEQYAEHLADKPDPLLIIDDAHKLKDRVLHLVVLLANSVNKKLGVALMGDENLQDRITEGARLKKVGYDEIYKSIGKRFITLRTLAANDLELVCNANGVYDEGLIKEIAEQSDNLHEASRLIQRQTPMSNAA